MSNLKNILIYILNNYPHKDDLSNARLTKLVYLSDWYHAIHNKKQISTINWYFDNYGPFVWDIYKQAQDSETFKVHLTKNIYGKEKKLITLKEDISSNIPDVEKISIDKIIDSTQSLNWDEFIKLVYSTYPILTTEKYNFLNLIEKAEEHVLSKQ